ncbi:MAG: hypothetical protein IJV01_07255 [Bacteroidales bacterium]|nr:hypothetical protein [Bacteroidales bacterium]
MKRTSLLIPFCLALAALAGCDKQRVLSAPEDETLYPLTLQLSGPAESRSALSGSATSITQAQSVQVTIKRSGTEIVEYSDNSAWGSASRTLSLTAGAKDIYVSATFTYTTDPIAGPTLTQVYSGSALSVSVPQAVAVSVTVSPQNSRIKIGNIAVNNSGNRLVALDRFEICGVYVQDFSASYPGPPSLFTDSNNEYGNQGYTAHYGTVTWNGNEPSSQYSLTVPGFDDVICGGMENPYFYVNVTDATETQTDDSSSWTKHLRATRSYNDNAADRIQIGGSLSLNQYFFVPPGATAAKLVIWAKTRSNGTQDFYYHIPLPTLVAGKSYEIATATITRYGSTDPANPVVFDNQDFTIVIQDYETVSVTDGTTI